MRKGEFVRLSGCVAIALLATAACQRGGRKSSSKKSVAPPIYIGDSLPPPEKQGVAIDGGTLRIAMSAEPPSLNYQLDPLDAWSKKINNLIFESMARPNVRTWEHEPRLAERWEVSEDKLDFTFYLRRGVRWHDGKPFTADDVIFTLDKLLDPTSKTLSIRSYLEPIESYQKLDSHTVRFHLKRRYWFAFDAIAELFIYPKHIFGKGDFNTHPGNRAPVGTGRFEFVHWKVGDQILLRRNERYFGPKTRLAKVLFKYIPDSTVRTQLLVRGDIDVIEKLSPTEWRNRTADPALAERFWRLRHVPGSLQWIGWNESRPMFADRRVRRALTMLIDREDIVQNLRLGLDMPAASWFYPGTKEYSADIEPWPYDPRAAERLLKEAGWVDTNGDGVRDKEGKPFRFTFLYPAGPPFYEQLASLMHDDFKKAGIEVRTARTEWAVYTERLRKHEFDACSLLWQMSPRSDPYQVWHSSEVGGGSNFISFMNKETDRLLVAAREEFDETKRISLYRQFNRTLHNEQPYTFLFHRFNLSMVSKKFGGVISTPYGILSYGDFYLRKEGPTLEKTSTKPVPVERKP